MRFDDSLRTVLSADQGPGYGAQSAWRQIVDLLGRGRIPVDAVDEAMARLRDLRDRVPVQVRAASGRALAFARPPAALVAFFATDTLAIAAPVLRTATLDEAAWLDLLGALTPATRSVVRQRRDLPAGVVRALESFGATDFALSDASAGAATVEEPAAAPADEAEPAPIQPIVLVPDAPLSPTPFVALGEVARGLPVVAEALRRADEEPATPSEPPRYEIADLVARIEAFNRDREDQPATTPPAPIEAGFRFETDVTGTIRWVEGVARAALVGVSIARPGIHGVVRIDAGVAAAFHRRGAFCDLRLEVEGLSDAAGSWRIAGTPIFEPASGRFTGFHGAGRRPLRHESAAPLGPRSTMSEGLRQLVHELRTPANAVAGFAELIETELLGPVADAYRQRASAIRSQASGLLTAIDDLDTAARIEGQALELRPGAVPLGDLAARLATDLAPLARQRGATLTLSGEEAVAATDDRAAERLMARLLATLVSAASAGERIGITVHPSGEHAIVAFDRPRALADLSGDALFSLDGIGEGEDGAPLLGAGFTLRLVRNLAVELGGALSIEPDRLVLRLPALRDRAADHTPGVAPSPSA
ncbi:HAMP domain-containing sensor histidine kinase [Sphingomonas sp. KR1UV-12]|uniref:histidine kinase n=1 Tax=Sphingomonas aurea TaxID=3063994 RepID=A0ABT9EHV7_9SPHN|nr:HAMP domain-containing sensor histidine kinase [Sphingomonas sp. KR1UV-12]MDP1026420.1 HAMP domain-containing sensor histidine kinase [Sphingomonas sp. KR1UV-12]